MYIAIHEIATLEQLEEGYRRMARTLRLNCDADQDRKFRLDARRAYGPLISLEEQVTEDEIKEMSELGVVQQGDEWRLSKRQQEILAIKARAGERIIDVLRQYVPPLVGRSGLKPNAFVGIDSTGNPQLVMTDMNLPEEQFPTLSLCGLAKFKGCGFSNNLVTGSRFVVAPWDGDWIGLMGATLGFAVDEVAVSDGHDAIEEIKSTYGFAGQENLIGRHILEEDMEPDLRERHKNCSEAIIVVTMQMLSKMMSGLPADSSAVQALYDEAKPLLIVSDRVEERPLSLAVSTLLAGGAA